MNGNSFFKSERLHYRPYQAEDIQTLVRLRNEKTYLRWFYFLPLTDENLAAEQIEQNIATWSRPVDIMKDQCDLAIALKDTGELIGSVGLSKFHGVEELKDIEIGYDIAQAHQGKGYATEAARAAVAWGMDRLREIGAAPKIVGKAEHENWPSRRVLEKAGFAFVCAEKYCSVYQISE